MTPASDRRALLGNLLVGAALLAIALWLLRLQHDAWILAAPRPAQWWSAAICVLAYLGGCAIIAWRSRPARRDDGDGDGDIIIAWASQTGFAASLAQRSAKLLNRAGQGVQVMPLEHVDAQLLGSGRRMLFIVSTTGEGDPPDHALLFLRRVIGQPAALDTLHYGLLALGDRRYQQFCAFGQQLDGWLGRHGAHPLFDRVEVDNAEPAMLRHWQQLLAQLVGATPTVPDWSGPDYQPWRLDARRYLNPGSRGGAVFELALSPATPMPLDWQAGDIAEVGPRHAAAVVERWLREAGLDGDTAISGHRHARTLAELLARSRLPATDEAHDPATLAATLAPLPHREYSIASTPAEGRLLLLLRRQTDAAGNPGLASGWLCDHAAIGGAIALRLRANPGFHPPASDAPLLLIGNGTGIAGLRAQLRARIEAGARRNWLIYGERNARCDDHYGTTLRQWQHEGWIERLDAVFSRDGERCRYVQHRLHDAADSVRAWIDDGATIMVCGGLRTMAPGVDAALQKIMGAEGLETLRMQGRYRRDVY